MAIGVFEVYRVAMAEPTRNLLIGTAERPFEEEIGVSRQVVAFSI